MKFILGIFCLIYLLMPNLGVVELLPDFLPVVGHLDELAVTFLMTHFFGIGWGRDNDKPNLAGFIMFIIVGAIALLYLVYPSFSTFELLPDTLPIVGNGDEILASLLLAYITNSVRSPEQLEAGEEVMMIEGELAEDASG